MLTALLVPVGAWASHRFTDVSESDWAHADISWLGDAGVTLGCGDGEFCPDDPVTRRQMAAFMHRLSGDDDTTLDGRLDALEALPATSYTVTEEEGVITLACPDGSSVAWEGTIVPSGPLTPTSGWCFYSGGGPNMWLSGAEYQISWNNFAPLGVYEFKMTGDFSSILVDYFEYEQDGFWEEVGPRTLDESGFVTYGELSASGGTPLLGFVGYPQFDQVFLGGIECEQLGLP